MDSLPRSLTSPPRLPCSVKEEASPLRESSDVLFCRKRREGADCAPCWASGSVTEDGTEWTIWIPPMGIIGYRERTCGILNNYILELKTSIVFTMTPTLHQLTVLQYIWGGGPSKKRACLDMQN